ncbi:MAG: carboxylesterase/lipase family protein [Acidobacteriota bacterium]
MHIPTCHSRQIQGQVKRMVTTILLAMLFTGVDFAQSRVPTTAGVIEGTFHDGTGVREFKGIPYAAPPVGAGRWRAPRPVARWRGIRKAQRFGAACIQRVAGSRLPWSSEFMVQEEISEDCLFLNVWTAAGSSRERRPVLVYLHGGGYQEGSGAVEVYDGSHLARRGLVVVTLNYRLGVLGYLAHPELTAEARPRVSGNYGMLDQIAALRWVRQNIAAFGGDPARVTIAGQSAGASSVHNLLASPLAKGLFHRAIAQSGSSVSGLPTASLDAAEKAGSRYAGALGAPTLRELRGLKWEQLLAGAVPPVRFAPVIDGWALPVDALAAVTAGRHHDVPVLTGLNADEASSQPSYGRLTAAEFLRQAAERYGELTPRFLALYPAGSDSEAATSQKEAARDRNRVSMHLWAARRARTSRTPAWTYYFSRAIPWPPFPQYGAFHTGEVPYVFGTTDRLDRPWQKIDGEVRERMLSYWVNFVTAGNPNGAGLPDWPAFDPAREVTFEIGDRTGSLPIASPPRRLFFTEYLQSPRLVRGSILF